jgi:hypothetical protein
MPPCHTMRSHGTSSLTVTGNARSGLTVATTLILLAERDVALHADHRGVPLGVLGGVGEQGPDVLGGGVDRGGSAVFHGPASVAHSCARGATRPRGRRRSRAARCGGAGAHGCRRASRSRSRRTGLATLRISSENPSCTTSTPSMKMRTPRKRPRGMPPCHTMRSHGTSSLTVTGNARSGLTVATTLIFLPSAMSPSMSSPGVAPFAHHRGVPVGVLGGVGQQGPDGLGGGVDRGGGVVLHGAASLADVRSPVLGVRHEHRRTCSPDP